MDQLVHCRRGPYIYVLHSRLSQILGDAMYNGNQRTFRRARSAEDLPEFARSSSISAPRAFRTSAEDLMTDKRLHNSELDLPLFHS